MPNLDELSINTLRFLAIDSVEKAKSGHPGAPLGGAPLAYLLFHQFMKHNPAHPKWIDRDRFILSHGHASALLYATLHLSGYSVSLEDLKQFRQWGSKTPGHPEFGHTEGVEVTTGPLGQGFAMGIGMAIAEKHLAARYNRPGFEIVNHFTYAMCSDGDLMEGISHEAASLAGTLKLGKVIYLYDDNLISLDGPTDLSYTEDVSRRFESYHWHVQTVADGNHLEELSNAIRAAQEVTDRPSLIRVRTQIGYGSPKAGTSKCHGEPLGAEAIQQTRANLKWPHELPFHTPQEALQNWRQILTRGQQKEALWNQQWANYQKTYPDLAREFQRTQQGKLNSDTWESLPSFPSDSKRLATRSASHVIMNALAERIPELFGGAADLSVSTKTHLNQSEAFHRDPQGRNLFFGVREFGMMAVVNGIAAHGGMIPYGSTFFTFSDYCKPALRLAALMRLHTIFVFTHDSIALGEDGPTHQPVEHLMMLRVVPHLTDYRPADANETAAVWRLALERKEPSFMALSRQDLPVLDPKKFNIYAGVSHGAYPLDDAFSSASNAHPDVILVASGAEIWPALKAAELLAKNKLKARVISMPSFRLFEEQTQAYKRSIFPETIPKLAIEAGATLGWWKYVGTQGDVIGLDRFGASAPGEQILQQLGFGPEAIADRAQKLVERVKGSLN